MFKANKKYSNTTTDKLHYSIRTNKGKQTANLKTPISRWKIERDITNCFKSFFKEVHNVKLIPNDKDIIVQCKGVYLDYDTQANIIGGSFRFKTERDKIYAICQMIHAYLFHKHGLRVHLTREYNGEFTFCVYDAYLRRRKH